jgi:hypothetical protein
MISNLLWALIYLTKGATSGELFKNNKYMLVLKFILRDCLKWFKNMFND